MSPLATTSPRYRIEKPRLRWLLQCCRGSSRPREVRDDARFIYRLLRRIAAGKPLADDVATRDFLIGRGVLVRL
jgi:hypothetical protein